MIAAGEHLFWVPDRGEWVEASELQAGDRVRTAEGEQRLVTSIRTWTALQRVQALTVDEDHTYYVALNDHDETLVHNSNPQCWDDGGWVQYGELDQGRATGMTARVTRGMLDTGTSANNDITPAGFMNGKSPNSGGYGHARGHLLAKKLGGSGDIQENLMTLYQNPTNSKVMWHQYEKKVRDRLKNDPSVEYVDYSVTPHYNGSDSIPSHVEMWARDSRGRDLFEGQSRYITNGR